jgi:hypothetical protein
MPHPIKKLVKDYGWIHLGMGLMGNAKFFIGSILFLPVFEPYKTIGVWLFITGSFLMMIGSLGRLLVDIWENGKK